MGTEIERKYLVTGQQYRELGQGTLYRQGYLSTVKERTVRVRIAGPKATLTVKGLTVGESRPEFEYEIPVADAEELLVMCEQPLVEKTRFCIGAGDLVWEVDEFHGVNEGLVLAECELRAADQPVVKPTWVGREVTADPRYYNANLVARPFTTW